MAMQERSNFFRVILPHILEMKCIELPSNFVKDYCQLLSKSVRLKVPTGEESKIELKMSAGRAWLHKGWKNFVDKYSIECGYFLVFKYIGGSCFRVMIFDRTSTEIKYPTSKLIQVKEEDDDVEILDEFPLAESREPRSGRGTKNKSPHAIGRGDVHFSVILQPTYISSPYLYIPKHPAGSYLLSKGSSMIRIVGEDGRDWCMKCEVGPPPLHRVKFNSGWDKFVQENRLRQGDKCGFDLISENPMTFEVSISRVTATTSTGNKRPAMKKAMSFKSKNPQFVIRITSYYVSSMTPKVHIPSAYAKRYILKESKHGDNVITLHGSNGGTWRVHCYRSVRNSVFKALSFTKGWKVFVSQNRLRVGDLLVFEMIGGDPMAYKLTITRS